MAYQQVQVSCVGAQQIGASRGYTGGGAYGSMTVLIVKTIWDHSSRLLSQSYYTDNINTCCDIFNAYHLCDIGAVDTAGPDASGSRRGERLCVGRAMRRI